MELPALKIGDIVARIPIVQGGMGVGVSLAKLASAVANEGAIGTISAAMIGMDEPDIVKNPIEANNRALRNEIRKAKELSDGIIGVNIMVALTTFADAVRTAIEEKVDIIFAGAGLPLDLPKHLRDLCEEKKEDFKTKLVPIVSSARAASVIAKKWQSRFAYTPDAFVLEGPKAGGHLGYSVEELDDENFSVEKVLPELVKAVKAIEETSGKTIPIIVGGGVFDGKDMAKMFELGASGVQLGTRFVATDECDADITFKNAIVEAKAEDLTIIKSPVGMPGRAIEGEFIKAVKEGKKKPVKCVFHCIHTCNPETTPYCISSALISATKGRMKSGFVFCGTNAPRVDRIMPVKELIHSIVEEYNQYSA